MGAKDRLKKYSNDGDFQWIRTEIGQKFLKECKI